MIYFDTCIHSIVFVRHNDASISIDRNMVSLFGRKPFEEAGSHQKDYHRPLPIAGKTSLSFEYDDPVLKLYSPSHFSSSSYPSPPDIHIGLK
jgi:hypothetical protein